MKSSDILKKAREKACAMPPKKKLFEFVDLDGKEGSCNVWVPGERFNFKISRQAAESLLIKHKDRLPFDIMRPLSVNEDDDWKLVTHHDLLDRYDPLAGNQEKCSLKPWEVFEIWIDFEKTD